MSQFLQAEVSKDASGHYHLQWQLREPQPVTIYRSDILQPEYEVVATTAQTDFELALPLSAPQQHFMLKTETAIFPLAERRLGFEGTSNLRDFGGYRGQDGYLVDWGKLFRSGKLSRLTTADQDYLQQLGIRKIFDFRRGDETQRSPTRLTPQQGIEICPLPIGEGSHMGFIELIRTGDLSPAEAATSMEVLYQALALSHGTEYRQVFNHMLHNSSDPLLIHCTAGKDRTGVGAALILLLLGVDKETVMEDYLLTNRYFPTESDLEYVLEMLDGSPAIHDAMMPMMQAQPEYLQSFFSAIEDGYDSLEHYFQAVFDLTPAEREQIQSRYLKGF